MKKKKKKTAKKAKCKVQTRQASKKQAINRQVLRTKRMKARFLKIFFRHKCNIGKCCETVGIGRQTYYNWMNDDLEFQQNIIETQERLIDWCEQKLFEAAAAKDTKAIIFLLTNLRRSKWQHLSRIKKDVNTSIAVQVELITSDKPPIIDINSDKQNAIDGGNTEQQLSTSR